MNPATTEFLRQRFTEYYKKTVLVPPPSLDPAGVGFCPLQPRFCRHAHAPAYRILRPGRDGELYPQPHPAAYLLLDGLLREAGCRDHGGQGLVRGRPDLRPRRRPYRAGRLRPDACPGQGGDGETLAMLTEEFGMDKKSHCACLLRGPWIPCPCPGYRVPRVGKCRTAGADRLCLRDRDRPCGNADRKGPSLHPAGTSGTGRRC